MTAFVNRVCDLFFIFMLFSFAGWLSETLIYIIRKKQAVKRGFLFGPVCPIYGTAAILCDLVLYNKVENPLLIFVIGFFMSGVLEYFTHFAMEKLFHAMWWDYSGRKFNLNGRIYLKGLVIFGVGVVIIVKLLLPLSYKLLGVIPRTALYIGCFLLYSILIIDITATVADLKDAIRTIKNFQASFVSELQKGVDLTAEQIDKIKDSVTDSELYKLLIKQNPVIEKFKLRHPNFKLTNSKFINDVIINASDESKERTDLKLYGTADTAPKKEEEDNN